MMGPIPRHGRRPLWGMVAAVVMIVCSCAVAMVGAVTAARIVSMTQN